MGQGLVLAEGNVGRGIYVQWGREGADEDSTALRSRMLVTGGTPLIDGVTQLNQRGLLFVVANSVCANISEDDAPQGLGLDEVVEARRHVDDAGPVVDHGGGDELLLVHECGSLQSSLEFSGKVGGQRATDDDGTVISIQMPVTEVRDGRARGPDLNDLMSIRGMLSKLSKSPGST